MLTYLPVVVVLAASASPSGYDAVFGALPGQGDGGVRIEAAFMVRDMQGARAWVDRFRGRLQRLTVGHAYLQPAVQQQTLGFDWGVEWARLADLVDPAHSGTPAALVLFSSGKGVGVQLMAKVAPGFEERLSKLMAQSAPPPWRGAPSSGGFSFSWGRETAPGQLDANGWLRIAPSRDMLIAGQAGPALFEPTMARWLADSDMALFVRSGGMFDRTFLKELRSGPLKGLRALAMTWSSDGDRTATTRLLVDAASLEGMRPMLRDPALTNNLVTRLDSDATAYLSLALPRPLVQSLVPAVQQALADTPYALPDEAALALTGLSGQVGMISFGSPGDWGLVFEMVDEKTAAGTVPALASWWARAQSAGKQAAPLEPYPGLGEPVMHLRPDPALEGVRVARLGTSVVLVSQRARLASLANAHGEFLNGPLTPAVRELAKRPAMLNGYAVLGTTGMLFDWLVSYWGVMQGQVMRALPAELNVMRGFVERTPLLLSVAAYSSLLTYDLTATADLDSSVLVVQLLTSDL